MSMDNIEAIKAALAALKEREAPARRSTIRAEDQSAPAQSDLAELRSLLAANPDLGTFDVTLPTATACFELYIGNLVQGLFVAEVPPAPPQVVIPFQVTVDLTSYPYNVLSGTFIFDSPEVTYWQITQGQFGTTLSPADPYVPNSDDLYIVGEYIPPTNEVPEAADGFFVPPQISIYGLLRPPLSYSGLLFSGGGLYNACTLFKGWQACS